MKQIITLSKIISIIFFIIGFSLNSFSQCSIAVNSSGPSTGTLSVSVIPSGLYSYQWSNNSGPIAGATSSILSGIQSDCYTVEVFSTIAPFALVCTSTVCLSPTKVLNITVLNSQLTSINMPITGNPSTGPITATLNSAYTGPSGHWDCNTQKGVIYWPTTVNFPLLTTLGLPPLQTTFVGQAIVAPFNSEALVSSDMGFTDLPGVGPICMININPVTINTILPPIAGPMTALCATNASAPFSFNDLTIPQYNQIGSNYFRNSIDSAYTLLQQLNPSVPLIPSSVFDSMHSIHASNPNTEFIMYFVNQNEYRTSELTGTGSLAFSPNTNPVPTISQWGLLILCLLSLALGVVFISKRQHSLALAGTSENYSSSNRSYFNRDLYLKTYLKVLGVGVMVLILYYVYSAQATITDTIGMVISTAIIAYIIHYLLLLRKK